MSRNSKRFNEDEFFCEDNEPTEYNGAFDHLLDLDEECPRCGYYGPLVPSRKGYRCFECRLLIIKGGE